MATSPMPILQIAGLFICLANLFLYGFLVCAEDSKTLVLSLNKECEACDEETGSLAITHVPSSVSFRSTAGSIKLQDIPQVISLALGFSSLQDVEWKGLLAGKVFDHPKANILFIIEGLDKGATLPFFSKTQSYPIVKKEGQSNLGVVRISPLRNFVSHMVSILEEKPLVVSFSADNRFAHASSAQGPNAHTVTWDSKENSFNDSKPRLHGMTVLKNELLKKFETANFGEDVKYRKEDNMFVVSVPGMGDTTFDMGKTKDFLFFAELEMIAHLYEKVKSLTDLLQDDYPDFYTFGISSLKGLSRRYGNNSRQVLAGLHVLNSFVPQISSLFNELYGGQALVEVVNLQSKIDFHKRFSTEMNDIYDHVQHHLQSQSQENFNENLPELNLRENLENYAISEICESLRSKLLAMQSKLKVNCGVPISDGHKRSRREITANTPVKECKNNTYNMAIIDDYYDSEFPPIFNITLWLMIVIALALYAVSLVLWYMDPGRDSVIYRVTSQRMKTD